MGSYLLNSGLPFESAKAMAPGELQVQGPSGQKWAAGHRPRLRSGIQLGEASSRLPEGLVQFLWVGEEGHHQGVGHRQPTQPLLFVATQRLREHQVQMLKKCEDGLVVHHEAACLGTSPSVDRALPTVRLLQPHRRNTPVVAGCSGRRIGAAGPCRTDDLIACMTRAHTSRLSASVKGGASARRRPFRARPVMAPCGLPSVRVSYRSRRCLQ